MEYFGSYRFLTGDQFEDKYRCRQNEERMDKRSTNVHQ
jgi:hypothetical protein